MSWDELAESYDRWFQTDLGRKVDELETDALLRLLGGQKSYGKVAEIGVGTGHFTRLFIGKATLVVGVDLSMEMLKIASRKLKSGNFLPIQADALNLPFKSNYFDLTASITMLEFVHDWKSAVAEMVRVTKPGGQILIGVLNRFSSWAKKRMKSGKPPWNEAHFFTPRELIRELSRYGEVEWTSSVFFPPNPKSLVLAELMEFIGRTMMKHKGALILAKCQIGAQSHE